MKKLITVIVVLASARFVLGGLTPPLFQDLPKTSVVVRIDGKDIRKRDIERDAKMFMILGMNKSRHTKIGGSEKKQFRKYCYFGGQIAENREIIGRYALEHGLTNSLKLVERITHQVERQYGIRSKKLRRWHNLNDLKFILGPNASRLDAEITARATYETVTNYIITSSPVVVTSEMVSNRIATTQFYNRRMAATNGLVYARATNVWKQIEMKALTFEQAATNFSEDVYLDMGCEWGTFSLNQLSDDPAVMAMLPSLKVGVVTPPLESDGGLAILRVDEIDQNKNYTFSRVFFRLPMFFDEETPEEATASLKEEIEANLIKRALDEVRARMRFEYPSGTNLFAAGSAPLKITKEALSD